MNYNDYLRKLGEIPGSRLNKIIHAVNCNVPKSEIGLDGEVETMFYDNLMREADEHEREFGERPVFASSEIESDDPSMDIYNGPVKESDGK